jgi:hypothetical protein
MIEKNTKKKVYTTPRLTTHGDVAKLTLSRCDSEAGCHSHLPTIPGLPAHPGRRCK